MQVIFGLFAPPGRSCPHARKVAIASRICRLCLKRKSTRPHNLLLPVLESSVKLLATDTGRHRPAHCQLHASYIRAICAARSELPSRKAAIASRICRLCLKRKPTRPHNLLLPVPESSANLLATDTGRHRPARWQLHVSYIWAIRAARSELPSSKAAIASRICRLCLKRKLLPSLRSNVILWRILCARSCRTRPA